MRIFRKKTLERIIGESSKKTGSTKFRTDEKGHELKAHDSFFLKIDIK